MTNTSKLVEIDHVREMLIGLHKVVSLMKNTLTWVMLTICVLLMVAVMVIAAVMAEAIWNSDLPVWLKYFLLK